MYSLNQKLNKKNNSFVANLVNADVIYQRTIFENNRARNNTFKRFFDIVFSSFVLVLVFSWLFPILAILIKLSSKGPVLFIQDRVGLDNKYFKCYKFRTMKCEPVKYMYTPTVKGDSRISKLGSILRKTNLDELPQFINVFKGEMSVVGPRPHAIAFHKTYATFIENISLRQTAKPGITGLAQIMGYRGDVEDFEENKKRTKKRVEFDMLYIAEWKHKLDYIIITTTILQMLGRKTQGH